MWSNFVHISPVFSCRVTYVSDGVDPILGSNYTLKLVTQIAYMLIPGDMWGSAEDSFEENQGFYLLYCKCNQYVVPMITYDVRSFTPR